MKSRAKVVVIGGGIVDCSTLYDLTQEGWFDFIPFGPYIQNYSRILV